RLRLYGREDHQRYVTHDRAGQPRPARALQPILLVEQVPDQPDLGGCARRDLFLGFLCIVRRHRAFARLRPLRRRRLCQDRREVAGAGEPGGKNSKKGFGAPPPQQKKHPPPPPPPAPPPPPPTTTGARKTIGGGEVSPSLRA